MVNGLYILGLIIGITVVYIFATMGVAAILTHGESDSSYMFFCAWLIGLAAFIVVSMSALDAKGFIHLNSKPIVEETQSEQV